MNAADVRAALARHWPDDRYAHVYEAPLDSGRQGSKVDVLVLGLWRSLGHEFDAVEVKVSYADWCKEWRRVEWRLTTHDGRTITSDRRFTERQLEPYTGGTVAAAHMARFADEPVPDDYVPTVERIELDDTSKNADWRAHAHRFWVAAPEALAGRIALDVLNRPALAGWGVLAVTATSCAVAVKPTRHAPTPLQLPHWVGIVRAAADSGANALTRAFEAGRQQGYREGARMKPAAPDQLRLGDTAP